jgi:hypothetical protein
MGLEKEDRLFMKEFILWAMVEHKNEQRQNGRWISV